MTRESGFKTRNRFIFGILDAATAATSLGLKYVVFHFMISINDFRIYPRKICFQLPHKKSKLFRFENDFTKSPLL